MSNHLETLFQNRFSDVHQKKAWAEWLKRGFPTRKSEAFRYVSLKKLEEANHLEAACEFVYQAPSEVVITSLQEAKRSYGPLLEKRYAELAKKEQNPFFFLNQALGSEGLFIYVPPNCHVQKPLQIMQKIAPGSLVHPKIEIFVGKGGSLSVVMDTEGKAFWQNGSVQVTVEEGARYSHYDCAKHHPDSWDFSLFRATLMKESHLSYFSFGRGALVQRRDLAVALNGEHARADLKGMSLLDEKLEGHVHIRIDHCAPDTHSNQFFKHVLSQSARSSFEGKIYVEKEAQKTEAYQLNNNLILSERAAAFSKPNLEIFADDVKASHGATVSKPRLDERFYLRSRGLSEKRAQDLLVRGFCRELIQELPLSSLREQFSGEIDAYLT